MELIVVAPCGMICHTTVDTVSLPGVTGCFHVREGDLPFVTDLSPGEIVYADCGRETSIRIKNGTARIEPDLVEICADIATENNTQKSSEGEISGSNFY